MCVASYRYRVGVVYLELCGLIFTVGRPAGQQVEEHLQQLHVLPRHVGDLEDGAHPARRKDGEEVWEQDEDEEDVWTL